VTAAVGDATFLADRLAAEIGRVVVGQRALVDRLMVALVAGGHLLLEGPPGVAKTLVVRTLAQALQLSFQRIQFTPDLLPADIVGTPVYNQREGTFVVHRGPIFANVVLADEINRAPAKVQSALLEVMQEHRVTIGGETMTLEEPFLVLATQNPLEHEGTYPLPEAQLDRFFMQVIVPYPTPDEEREIVRRHLDGEPPAVSAAAGRAEIARARAEVRRVLIADRLLDYILAIVAATRRPASAGLAPLGRLIRFGASPRAALHLAQASRAWAYLARRGHVLPEDVKAVAPDVLSHRLMMSYEADTDGVSGRDALQQILDAVAVP
jgi:MoxR-like ATPase